MEPPDEFIQVLFLETSEDHGILDPDDLLCDVVDDKDKLLAVFQEGSSQTLHRPAQNGGYGTSTSSIGTASPDLSQHEDETLKYIEEPPLKPYTSNNNKVENTNGEIKTVSRVTKSPPPPVPPKPVRHISVNSSRTSYVESIPSEDSGISTHDERFRIGSDSSKSETIENVVVKPTIYRTGEMTFVAIGTPVKPTVYNGHANIDRRRFSSTSSDHADNEHSNSEVEEETFSLGRNSARKSMFVDSPMLDRWAELQEERMFVGNNHREEPVSTVTSPSEPSSNEPDFAVKYHDDQRSESSESSGEPDMLMIELKREDPLEPLGFTVAGYRTADSRELGLIVRNISPDGCAARDGRLEIADRIVEVNGWSLMDMPNERAEELFAAAIKASVVSLGVSRSHSFVPGQKSDAQHEEEIIQARPAAENNQSPEPLEQSQREILPLTPQSLIGSPSIPDSSFKKVNKRILIELMKGNDGLGFSITTRDNPAGGNTPIFVKSILPKGAAIEGGQLKAGDQIVEVNGQKMNGKSQAEAVNALRSTRGLVSLLVQREEVVQSPRAPAIEVNEDSLRHFREEGLQVLTFKIPLDIAGAAGLGVSVKGKSRATSEQGRDSPQDKGIFVKSIIPGGAAAKDGRLCPDDQLLRVNNKSLVGLTNQAAMETLRLAMQSTRPNQAFIDVAIAREQDDTVPPPGELLHSSSLEKLNAPDQERPIEAGSDEKPVEEPQRSTSETDGSFLNKERIPSNLEDQFNESITSRNLTPIRARNAVHRNDSYCVAVNKSQSPGSQFYSPFRQRPIHRPSPLAMGNDRAQPLAPSSLARTSTPAEGASTAALNVPSGRPTSTVAIPTPPLGSTDERPSGPGSPAQAPAKPPPPQPPPRWDSAADNYRLPTGLQLKLKMPDAQRTQEQRAQEGGSNASSPGTPPPPAQFKNSSPTREYPPSYDQAVARLGRSPHASVSSEPTTPSKEQRKSWSEENAENQIIAPPSQFSSEDIDNPFQRDGFGRLSMTEMKRIAQKTPRVEEEETKPTIKHHPLRKADSDDQLRQQFEEDSKEEERRPSPYGRGMQKSRSTGQLKLVGLKNDKYKKSKSNDNLSFTKAVENANRSYPGDVQNGHAQFSHSVSEEEVPITMKSNADFTAVQQKLAVKKPFYKGISSVFKIGKNKRGDYNLSDNDGPAFKHTYNREALIDFPAEQRYRQLVNHYGQEKPPDPRYKSLPTRGRKKHEARERALEEARPAQTMKVGRVTVTAPTRV
ncbi:hypothetical protein ACROYT_G026648 [Oculina patagonica]